MSRRSAVTLLLALIVLAYGNSLTNGFVFDDLPLIPHNRTISDLGQLPGLFVRDYWAPSQDVHEGAISPRSGLYRPLVMASYSLNAVVGSLSPFGFHLVNAILHALVTSLLYIVAFQLGVSATAAFVAAALFAVHPIHTEAVTAIIGRAELMMSVCGLASLRRIRADIGGVPRLPMACAGRILSSPGGFPRQSSRDRRHRGTSLDGDQGRGHVPVVNGLARCALGKLF